MKLSLLNILRLLAVIIVILTIVSPQPAEAQVNSCMEGDTNHDGHITLADYQVWRTVYKGSTGASPTTTPSSPSGEAMPIGDLPGWRQTFTEDFTQDVTVGNFPGTVYDDKWGVYPDGWEDTAGKDGSPSRYYPSKVVSVNNGVLNKHLHFEDGVFMAAALVPNVTGAAANQLYGKSTVRFRAVNGAHGYKTAWLLWPESERWPDDGEIDFPEGDLDSTIAAFHHFAQPAGINPFQDGFITDKTYDTWHTASTEWKPGKVEFFLDGQSIGSSTTKVPNTPMRWTLQTESCLGGCPAQNAVSYVQIDWATAYSYNP